MERHRESLHGSLRACKFKSESLGIKKPYYIYEPPDLASKANIPLVYLFRGHEREWVNINEDNSRSSATAIEDIDRAIQTGLIPPMLAVLPGLNSSNNHIPSLGINMEGNWAIKKNGLGTGKFWNFLTKELIPTIDKRYPQASGPRLAAGFSLGGYTASLLAIKCPGLFNHVGIYDGLFMWPAHQDPRQIPNEAGNDKVWTRGALFDAAFDSPRNMNAMKEWNPTDILLAASSNKLQQLNKSTWWISCAASDGQHGNRDRAVYYKQLLLDKKIPMGFQQVLFDQAATHAWHWADRFLISFLSKALKKQQFGAY